MQFAGLVTRGQHKAIYEMRRSGSALDVFKFHALYILPINVIAIRDFVDFILQTSFDIIEELPVPSGGGRGAPAGINGISWSCNPAIEFSLCFQILYT